MKDIAKRPIRRIDPNELVCSERNVHTLSAPDEGRIFYRCDGPTGFRLMVTANGHRAFYMVYRSRIGGQGRTYKIGLADDLSFKEAKTRAEAIRGLVAQGRDPFAEDQIVHAAARTSQVVTLREAFNYYLAAKRHNLDPKTVQADEQTRDAMPSRLMNATAEEITPALFRDAVRDVTKAPVMQNRHLSRIKAVLRFAHREQKIGRLPAIVAMQRPHVERKRDRVLTEREIATLWSAADLVAPKMPRGGKAFAASVRLMLLLGTRRGETQLAEWDELDLEGEAPRSEAVPKGQPMWYIPAEHRKGERQRKRPHWIPLPPLAVSILRDLQAITGERPLIFWKAGESARSYMMKRLLEEMKGLGQTAPWSPHDLRRTCSTWLGEMGCSQDVNDLILGHVRKGVIAHYDHSKRLGERASWLQRWSERIAEITGLSEPGSEVLLHVYEAANGLPEIRTARGPEHGRRYVGAFPAIDAVRRAERMTREALRRSPN